MNGIYYSGSGTNQEIDDQRFVLPGYVPYLSLVFKMIATTVIFLLSGWVVYTIKTTRRLHKPQYNYVYCQFTGSWYDDYTSNMLVWLLKGWTLK